MKKSKKYSSQSMRRLFALFLILLMIPFISSGQSRKELEQERIKLQDEIKETKDLLFKSQKREKNLLSELDDINSLIRVRTKLIRTIEAETKELNKDIKENEKEVGQLQNRLEELKEEYAPLA